MKFYFTLGALIIDFILLPSLLILTSKKNGEVTMDTSHNGTTRDESSSFPEREVKTPPMMAEIDN